LRSIHQSDMIFT